MLTIENNIYIRESKLEGVIDFDCFDIVINDDIEEDKEFAKYTDRKPMSLKEKRIMDIKRALYPMCAISDKSKLDYIFKDKTLTEIQVLEDRKKYFNTDEVFGNLVNYDERYINIESSSSYKGSDIRINKDGDTALIFTIKSMLKIVSKNPDVNFEELPIFNALNQCLLALCDHNEKDNRGKSAYDLADQNDKVFEAFFLVYMDFVFRDNFNKEV